MSETPKKSAREKQLDFDTAANKQLEQITTDKNVALMGALPLGVGTAMGGFWYAVNKVSDPIKKRNVALASIVCGSMICSTVFFASFLKLVDKSNRVDKSYDNLIKEKEDMIRRGETDGLPPIVGMPYISDEKYEQMKAKKEQKAEFFKKG